MIIGYHPHMELKDKLYSTVLLRGLRKRCPQCGRGLLFESWYTIHDSCNHCQLDFVTNQANTWAFMYISTACLTGMIVGGMVFFRPENLFLGRIAIAVLAIAFIMFTLPYRKGIAMAFEYLVELKWCHNEEIHFQQTTKNPNPLKND